MPSTRSLATSVAILLLSSVAAIADPPGSTPPAAPPPAPALTVTVPTYINRTCPIMARPASRAMFADTAWGRIYICCPPCRARILADPERAYKTAYPTAKKAGNTVCPVTDKPLGADAKTVLLQGYEIGVCATCVEQARKQHQITLAKALDPKIVEVRNRVDPTNGQPVTDNDFCVIGKELIHLSSPKSVDVVRADPAKALKAAKEDAARPAPSAPPAR
jgi:hypothetical protein